MQDTLSLSLPVLSLPLSDPTHYPILFSPPSHLGDNTPLPFFSSLSVTESSTSLLLLIHLFTRLASPPSRTLLYPDSAPKCTFHSTFPLTSGCFTVRRERNHQVAPSASTSQGLIGARPSHLTGHTSRPPTRAVCHFPPQRGHSFPFHYDTLMPYSPLKIVLSSMAEPCCLEIGRATPLSPFLLAASSQMGNILPFLVGVVCLNHRG
jgi:hypothetical protein